MKRVLKQWTAGLLAAVLVLALLPGAAWAEEADGTTERSASEQVQTLLDALPDAEAITADNRADVEAQLAAIDEAKLALEDEELDALDTARYLAAVEALLALDDLAGADIPMPMDFLEDLPGAGTSEEEPHEISTKEQLAALSEYVSAGNNCENVYFKLTEDIDLGGEEWTPIGRYSTPFAGSFDGDGHAIRGLVIESNSDYQGLFGRIKGSGNIANLGVEGAINTEGGKSGGIVGWNEGTIENCYFIGTVTGLGGQQYGGIAGRNEGTIRNCYNAGTISNNGSSVQYFGGIAGVSKGPIQDCYNIGAVNGLTAGGIAGHCDSDIESGTIKSCYNAGKISGSYFGGIVGSSNGSTTENCYYLEGTADTGIGNNFRGDDKTESKSAADFKALAETLNGSGSSVWEDDPFLGRPVLKDNPDISGTGDAGTPYLIPDKTALENFRNYVNAGNNCEGMYFELTADIDLGSSGDDQWTPIGSQSKSFAGIFDGGGHTISGLYINEASSESYQSLFGHIGTGGTVKNLTVEGSVIGGLYSAGIAGQNEGTVENCCNKGSVSGTMAIGGIVGVNNNGTVKNCHNTGNIIATSYCGDIVGMNNSAGTVENCYNTGNISGGSSLGGIVGQNEDGTVTNCYYPDSCGAAGEGTKKTADEFASGEVTYLLQDGQDPQVWGQTVGADYPELTDSADKTVYKITGVVEDQVDIVWYSNNKATLSSDKPTKEGSSFAGWSKTNGGTVDFTSGVAVNADMKVYAVWKVPFDGSGTELDPYIIPDEATLEAFRDYINTGHGEGEYFKLTNNIDLGGSEDDQWTPIGNDNDHRFKGTFDGDGHTISGLYINKSHTSCQGLFGRLMYATVKNLTVTGSITGMDQTGGIAGLCEISSIENCINECAITGGYGTVGGISGKCNGGSITGCRNTGTITAPVDGCGGIAGYLDSVVNYDAEGSVTDCFNTGAINSTTGYAGGIVGDGSSSGGTITNCYDTGTVYSMDTAGAIIGFVGAIGISNSYYLDTSCGAAGGGTAKNEAEFNSGEVAWLLQAERTPQVWGQTVGADYPELTAETDKKVYKVTFQADGAEHAVMYANPAGLAALPAAPALAGMAFDHWSTTNSVGGERFDSATPVTGDITLYAVGRSTFGGESDEIMLTTTYGTALTADLSQYVRYASAPETPAAGKFTYTITAGNETLGAETAGDLLTIPGTASAGSYTLTIQAMETEPEYTLMSVESYGADPVTLTVKVTISKADPEVTPPTPKTLTYTGAAQTLVTAGESNFGALVYSLTEAGPFTDEIPTATEAGTYTVYYMVEGSDNWNASPVGHVQAEIKKAASSAAVTGNAGLVYSGAPQPLVASGASETGTVVYALGENAETQPESGAFTETIPTGTDAGTYYVWWKILGDVDHGDSEPACVPVTIAKADPEVTAPTPKTLTYTGAAQELVEAGSATGGEMQYSLDGTTYSTAIPTGTDAQTYTVGERFVKRFLRDCLN